MDKAAPPGMWAGGRAGQQARVQAGAPSVPLPPLLAVCYSPDSLQEAQGPGRCPPLLCGPSGGLKRRPALAPLEEGSGSSPPLSPELQHG